MSSPPSISVLRVYHSAVVRAWRQRDRELRALGVDVTVVAPRRWNEGGADVALDADDDELVVGARTIGRHPYAFVYDPVALWGALRAARPDLIDIHEEPASLAAFEVWLLARLARRHVPFLLYCAQNIPKQYPVPFRWIERFLLRRAAAVHTCNDAAGRILRSKGFSGIVRNLGLGVDVDRFHPVERRAVPPLRVGYVGRLEQHKGVDVLIEAAAKAPGIVLEIIGDGPARDALTEQIRAMGLAGRVHITGFVDSEDLPTVYPTFDVVVVPSLETSSWIEQFGRVAVEAMACGVPVIASDSGSLPEVLGGVGRLIGPGDVGALADALREAADALGHDGATTRTLASQAARARAEHFSWAAIAQRQLALYRAALEPAP